MLYSDWIDLKAKYKHTIHDLVDYDASDIEAKLICPGVWPVNLIECKEHCQVLFFNLLQRNIKILKTNLSIHSNLKNYSDMLSKTGNISFLKLFKKNGKEVISKRYVLHETKKHIKIIKIFCNKAKPRKRFYLDLCIRFISEIKNWKTVSKHLDAALFNPVTGIEYVLPIIPD